jgi:hypothetical protein
MSKMPREVLKSINFHESWIREQPLPSHSPTSQLDDLLVSIDSIDRAFELQKTVGKGGIRV